MPKFQVFVLLTMLLLMAIPLCVPANAQASSNWPIWSVQESDAQDEDGNAEVSDIEEESEEAEETKPQGEPPAPDSSVDSDRQRLGIPELQQAMDSKQSTGDELKSTVGFPKLIYQRVIKGPELIAKPMVDKEQVVVVMIVETYPHGEHFRYDIEYKALEPGEYDLADYLVRDDGSDVPIESINVKVSSILGPGQVVPYELPPQKSGYQFYYLPLMLALGAVWVGGLLLILFYGRGKNKRPSSEAKQITVADRMKPLLDAAAQGNLSSQKQAELERVLTSFWSKKLRLGHLKADQLREHLRNHDEASLLLDQIDSWLHKPAGDVTAPVDVNKILEPYKKMDYDEIIHLV